MKVGLVLKPLREAEAVALLTDISAWCLRTGTPETRVGALLFRAPGFVGLLRLRRMVTEEKEQAVRRLMAEFPHGVSEDITRSAVAPPPPPRRGPRFMFNSAGTVGAHLSEEEIAARRVVRDPCPRCGCRGDFGCGHSRARLGTVL